MSIMPKSLITRLGIILIGVVVLALIAAYSTALPTMQPRTKEKFLPSLATELNQLTHIHITSNNEEVHLSKSDNFWRVREKNNLPADLNKVRLFIHALTESTLIQAKTKDAERYNKLGLNDEQATHVKLYSTDDKEPIFDIYLGNTLLKHEATYARIQGNPESWLISGLIKPTSNPDRWVDTNFLSVVPARIKTLSLTPATGTAILISRENEKQKDFTLQSIPKGFKMHSQADINQLSEILYDIPVQEGIPLAKANIDKNKIATLKIQTFDGVEVTVKIARTKEGKYASYSYKYNDNLVTEKNDKITSFRKQQVIAYNDLVKNTAFRIPDTLFGFASQTLDQFIEKQ